MTQCGITSTVSVHSALADLYPFWHRSQSPLQLNCPDTLVFLTTVPQSVDLRGILNTATMSYVLSVSFCAGISAHPRVTIVSQTNRSGDNVAYVNRCFVAMELFVNKTLRIFYLVSSRTGAFR